MESFFSYWRVGLVHASQKFPASAPSALTLSLAGSPRLRFSGRIGEISYTGPHRKLTQFDVGLEKITARGCAHPALVASLRKPCGALSGAVTRLSARKQTTKTLWQSVAASQTNNLPEASERRKLSCHRNNRFSNCSSKIRSFNFNVANSTPIPSPGTIFRTIASPCTFPPGT